MGLFERASAKIRLPQVSPSRLCGIKCGTHLQRLVPSGYFHTAPLRSTLIRHSSTKLILLRHYVLRPFYSHCLTYPTSRVSIWTNKVWDIFCTNLAFSTQGDLMACPGGRHLLNMSSAPMHQCVKLTCDAGLRRNIARGLPPREKTGKGHNNCYRRPQVMEQ